MRFAGVLNLGAKQVDCCGFGSEQVMGAAMEAASTREQRGRSSDIKKRSDPVFDEIRAFVGKKAGHYAP